MKLELPAGGWGLRPYQKALWGYLQGGGKRACVLWPRRHGKDDVALNWAACAAMRRPGAYWHMLPEATQARKAIWDAVDPHSGLRRIDKAFPMAMRETTRDTDMFLRFVNGSTWQVVGSDRYDSLVGTSPAGIVFSEWALADPLAWTYLQPILEENNGWAIFITTPRGENHATAMLDLGMRAEGWFAERLTAKECGVFGEDQLTRIRDEMVALLGEDEGDAKYRQEFLCDRTAAVPGAYYAKLIQRAEDEGRLAEVRHEPGFPVETHWDLGVGDDTAIWFVQRVGSMIHVIDYYENRGEGAPHYADVVLQKGREGRWVYGDHIVPHDARVRDWSIGVPRLEVLENLGIRATVQGTKSLTDAGYRADGIDQVRRQLAVCRFDRVKCERGIKALRNYHREWDDTRKVFSSKPEHDWSSHACDAFRVMAMHRPTTKRSRGPREVGGSAWAA